MAWETEHAKELYANATKERIALLQQLQENEVKRRNMERRLEDKMEMDLKVTPRSRFPRSISPLIYRNVNLATR